MSTVVQLLQATLDQRQHKQGMFADLRCDCFVRLQQANFITAEAALKNEEQHPGFSLLLLNIVASDSLPLTTRLSGALVFKNFIKFNWVVSVTDSVSKSQR